MHVTNVYLNRHYTFLQPCFSTIFIKHIAYWRKQQFGSLNPISDRPTCKSSDRAMHLWLSCLSSKAEGGGWDQLPKQLDSAEWQLVCVLSDVQDLVQNLTMESPLCDSNCNVLQFSSPTGATKAKKSTTSVLNFRKSNSVKTGKPTKKKLKWATKRIKSFQGTRRSLS